MKGNNQEYTPIPRGQVIPCVMCNFEGRYPITIAVALAPETNEGLCYPCIHNNEEARKKKDVVNEDDILDPVERKKAKEKKK